MKTRTILLAVILACSHILRLNAQTTKDSLAFINADWEIVMLEKGAVAGYAQIEMFGGVQSVSFVKFPSKRFRTTLLHSPGEMASTTDSLAIGANASIAINGSYFNMNTLYPHTFFSYRKRIVGNSRPKEFYRSNGILAFSRRSGGMEIFPYDTTMNDSYRRKYYAAIASGPLLLQDGEYCNYLMNRSFYKTRHPRSFVGMDDCNYYYFVVIDGRFPGQGDGANIPETAAIARYLGLKDAINVDGGGSSTLWTESVGVLNHPYDNHKYDHEGLRKVPNIIYAK